MDRLLRTLVSRAARRGLAGEPVWLAVAAAAWLVRRARSQRDEVVWSGRVEPGERIVIAVGDPGAAQPAPAGGE
jgi:hypothetical protein